VRTLHEREPGGLTRDRPSGVGIPGCKRLSRLNGWPMLSPANASPDTSRCPTHDKGSVWLSGRGADLLDTSPTDPGVQLSCTGLSSKVKRDRGFGRHRSAGSLLLLVCSSTASYPRLPVAARDRQATGQTRSPRFRRDPSTRDVALDPGRGETLTYRL
jgi:hypothetical protein